MSGLKQKTLGRWIHRRNVKKRKRMTRLERIIERMKAKEADRVQVKEHRIIQQELEGDKV